ncbi:MAG: helix-turn-helix transcriptional regulator [Pseudomonadota bacterium]
MTVKRKAPNPVDVHVGSRVRLRRIHVGMSQERLGELVGLTFQQIQKYENGANRIGASRLFEISQILDVPVGFFFEDLPGEVEEAFHDTETDIDQDAADYVMDFVSSVEGLQLNKAFTRIHSTAVRRRILSLVRTISGEEDEALSV